MARAAPEHRAIDDPTERAREAILEAAQARLLHFGYHKTTMAEIAEDAGMSAANLYRYFANKLDLAAACVTRSVNERLDRLRLIANAEQGSATEKLTAYALALIEHTYDLANPDSRVGEIVDIIARERRDLVTGKMAVHHELIACVLRQGVASGELVVDDPEETACLVYSALVLFDVPLFIGLFSREEFERRARGVVAVLVNGLKR